MPNEYIVSGTLIYGDEFELKEGYVVVKDGRIKEVCFERHESEISGLICPAFINAHTHVGDSFAKDVPYMPLIDIVAPPDGLKHRLLAATPKEEIARGITSTLNDMAATGTGFFIDFRENGIQGAELLRSLAGSRACILGRPTAADSIEDVLKVSDGAGISGANDIPRSLLDSIVKNTRKAGKIVGIHAGELNTSDIHTAIDTMPDFLIHMTQASDEDIRKVNDEGIPVAVCPRSNMVTGVGLPPVRKMYDEGICLALGTDNVMLNSANMFAEMEWVAKAFLHDDAYTLCMATLNGARIAGLEKTKGSIMAGKDADIIVMDTSSDNLRGSKNLLSSVVRRGRPDDISYFMYEGKIWQNCSRKS